MTLENKNMWISPEGEIYRCGEFTHYDRALEILEDLGVEYDWDTDINGSDRLHEMGYLRTQVWGSGAANWYNDKDGKSYGKITQAQKKILDNWIEEYQL